MRSLLQVLALLFVVVILAGDSLYAERIFTDSDLIKCRNRHFNGYPQHIVFTLIESIVLVDLAVWETSPVRRNENKWRFYNGSDYGNHKPSV